MSNSIITTSGVPQGSHLGPILFILFINDINNYITHSKFLLYADDLKLYSRINSPLDCSKLQIDLNSLQRWCVINGMNLNISKCCCLSFTKSSARDYNYLKNDTVLVSPTSVKDLCVLMDNKLTFGTHVAKKASRMLGFFSRSTRDFRSLYSLLTLYKALVIPILLYAS